MEKKKKEEGAFRNDAQRGQAGSRAERGGGGGTRDKREREGVLHNAGM